MRITFLSFVCSHSGSVKLHWQPKSCASSTCMNIRNAAEPWQSRARLQGSATGPWLNLLRTSGESGSKISITSEQHLDTCNVGARDWLVHNFEPNTDCGSVDLQTQHRVNLVHQPAKLIRIISNTTSHGGRVPESCPRGPGSFVATLVSACSSDGEEKRSVY